ncbi:hypothetical protein GCM10017673_54610 [Streptosporangium violaceochromogenes]|nr:hypothetical protein GCM10017673_54610 [Streptosporangium violaceochromogenes]
MSAGDGPVLVRREVTSHGGEVLRQTTDRGVHDVSDRSTPPSDHSHPTARVLIMEREFNTVKMSRPFPAVTRHRARYDFIGGERRAPAGAGQTRIGQGATRSEPVTHASD